MRFHKHEEVEAEDLLNLTSMIDVVFTLLAFFIITVRVFGVERDAPVAPSGQNTAAGLVAGDLPARVSVRLLEPPGSAGGMRIEIGGNAYTDPAAITAQLREINLPEVPVEFAVSPGLSIENVTRAVDAALHSPMRKVSLRQDTPGDASAAGGGASGHATTAIARGGTP